MLDAGPTVTVDGEMPWDKGQSLDPAAWSEVIPGDLAAQRLQSMHYATFSRSHNATVTLPAWRTTPMPEARVDELKLPKDPAYFSDREPTQYEYIRDHLGYRLSAKSLDLAVEDGTLQVSGDIANTGFSAPVKDYPVTVSLLDEDGKVVAEDEVDADLRTWQGAPAAERATAAPAAPEYPIEASLPLASLGEGNYTVALTIGDAEAAGQSAQLANVDVTFDDGRNELATITAEAPEPSPSPSPSSSVTPKPTPTVKPTPSVKPSPSTPPGDGSWVYVTPGRHVVNGRQWLTTCEAYSDTRRCRTEIWASTVRLVNGKFVASNGWSSTTSPICR